MTTWDTTVDLVIVGSGGGGMVAALDRGRRRRQRPGAREAGADRRLDVHVGRDRLGPEQPGHAADGVTDSYEDAMAHFEAVVGDVGPGPRPTSAGTPS